MINFTVGPVQSSDAVRAIGALTIADYDKLIAAFWKLKTKKFI